MKKLLAIAATTLLMTLGLAAQPASAACSMTGTGVSNDPWIILTPANLAKVGVVEAGGCLTTYNQPQHYRLGADIVLTGNFTPINIIASSTTGSFDGNNKVISGLNVSLSGTSEVGLFSRISGATVKDFTLTGSSVAGSNFAGAIAGYATGALIQNIKVVMSGNIQGAQSIGGLVGSAVSSSLTDLTYMSRAGSITGTSYVGGGFGQLESSTLNNVSVGTSVTATNIAGGVVGSFIPANSTTVNGITYSGTFVGDQYVGGLIGYLWSSGSNITATITNSSVMGSVATVTGAYTPGAFVGHVGNGVSSTVISKSFSSASYASASSSAATVLPADGTRTITNTFYSSWGGGTSITGATVSATSIATDALAGGSTWTVAQKSTYSTSAGAEEWVVDTSGNPMNAGKPMTKSSYNMGFHNPPCATGTYSATGFLPCTQAPLGKFVNSIGAQEALLCPVGTFAAALGSFQCTPASAGSYVADAGASAQQACAAGYTSGVGAAFCTPIAASGGGGAAPATGPRFSTKPTIKGSVAVGKTLELTHGSAISTAPVTYSYKWHRCAKPVLAATAISENAGCVAIDSATAASLALGSTDTKSFLTAQVTATSTEGSTTYFATSVNAKSLKFLALTSAPKLSGSAKVGKTVNLSKLSWIAAAPTKVSYQWYRCSSANSSSSAVASNCKAISGAKSSKYRVASADKKKYLTVKVTAELGSSKLIQVAGLVAKAS